MRLAQVLGLEEKDEKKLRKKTFAFLSATSYSWSFLRLAV